MATLPREPLQFAAVREDPRVEETVLRDQPAARVLLIASGGCTALYLRARFPELQLTLVEPNPAQVTHLQRKLEALAAFAPARFNVGTADPNGLQGSGNFERLFAVLRAVLDQFVIDAGERRARFESGDSDWDDVIAHPYWPVAFATAFDDLLLTTMFGPDAVQHAVPGSYPGYFRARLEAGLRADDRDRNPWLHHVLLGHYLDDPRAWPPFLQHRPVDLAAFEVIAGTLLDVEAFAPFDFVDLSNVPDWLAVADCRRLAARLGELAPGARILWRQLNDSRDLVGHEGFGELFECSQTRDAELTDLERSLFYDEVHLGIRR